MKIRMQKLGSFLLAVLFSMVVLMPMQADAAEQKVTMQVKNGGVAIIKGNRVNLSVTMKNADMKKAVFKSATKRIATVTTSGIVTGRKAGLAKIQVSVLTADDQKLEKTVKISVWNEKTTRASSLEVSGLKTISKGNKAPILYDIKRSNSAILKATFKSTNVKVAQVSKTGVVTARRPGTASIIVTATNKEGFTLRAKQRITVPSKMLTRSGGVNYYKGKKETWYTQKQLPGTGLKIPGRHVRRDGVICDKDGYVVIALRSGEKGKIVETSRGTGKCYDKNGTNSIDIYTNW